MIKKVFLLGCIFSLEENSGHLSSFAHFLLLLLILVFSYLLGNYVLVPLSLNQ